MSAAAPIAKTHPPAEPASTIHGAPLRTALSFAPRTMDEVIRLAKALSVSGLIPRALQGKPADVMIVLLHGLELGVSPMQALASIHVIEGRPGTSAELALGLVLRSGLCEHWAVAESTDSVCTVEACRKGMGGVIQRFSWSLVRAERAGLTKKDNWVRHPAAMLRARATLEACRAIWPDVIRGLCLPEEAYEQARESALSERVVQLAPPANGSASNEQHAQAEAITALEAAGHQGQVEEDPLAAVLAQVPATVPAEEHLSESRR